MQFKNAIVTGASSGLGVSFAELLAQAGTNLVLVGRNKSNLDDIKAKLESSFSVKVLIYKCDLQDLTQIDELFKFIIAEDFKCDLLVNNAGAGVFGKFTENSIDKELSLLDLNIKSFVYITKKYIAHVGNKNKAHILNVASSLSFRPKINYGTYSGAKTFQYRFSQILKRELKNSNISISIVCPGKICTNFDVNSGKLTEPSGLGMQPEFVAARALKFAGKGRFMCIPGIKHKIIRFMTRFTYLD